MNITSVLPFKVGWKRTILGVTHTCNFVVLYTFEILSNSLQDTRVDRMPLCIAMNLRINQPHQGIRSILTEHWEMKSVLFFQMIKLNFPTSRTMFQTVFWRLGQISSRQGVTPLQLFIFTACSSN